MRSSITIKLFLAILATCIIVALAMGMAVRYSFDSGFDDYVLQRESQRLDNLAQILAADYQESGGWSFLGKKRERWWRNLRLSRHDFADGRHGRSSLAAISLTDADGQWLAGPRDISRAGLHRHPVTLQGQTIGWLLSPPPAPMVLSDDLDRQFQSRQLRATWVIVGLSVLLAALVSLLLARFMLVSIRRIAKATHRLAGGDYSSRVQVGSSDELGRLAQDFNQLARHLEHNERLRREFMADMSHELRTPLAVVRAELEALQDGLRPLDQVALDSLAHEIGQLSKLIDDLYELSLADAGALNYQMHEQDLSLLVQQAAAIARDRFARAGLELQLDLATGLILRADAARILQLLSNLLENSLRYTDAPGVVRISAGRSGGDIVLVLADSAPGVAQQHLPKLFDRLYRVEGSRSRTHGGAGLGLAICRHIVLAHGGSIMAADSDLGGLEIRIILPAPDHHYSPVPTFSPD